MTNKSIDHTVDSFPALTPEQRQMAFIQERAMLKLKNEVLEKFTHRMIKKAGGEVNDKKEV